MALLSKIITSWKQEDLHKLNCLLNLSDFRIEILVGTKVEDQKEVTTLCFRKVS